MFEYAYQIGAALAYTHEARADSHASAQRCELPGHAVTSESELLTREPYRGVARRIDDVGVAIKSDQTVSRDLFGSPRQTKGFHIPPMREQAD